MFRSYEFGAMTNKNLGWKKGPQQTYMYIYIYIFLPDEWKTKGTQQKAKHPKGELTPGKVFSCGSSNMAAKTGGGGKNRPPASGSRRAGRSQKTRVALRAER